MRRVICRLMAVAAMAAVHGSALAQVVTPPKPALAAPAADAPPPLPQNEGPPPLPKAATEQYYYDAAGRPGGPVSTADLGALIKAGTVKPDTLIWTKGMAAWKPARDVGALAALFPAEDNAKTFIVGQWQARFPMANGGVTADATVSYAADGTFQASIVYTMPNSGLGGSSQSFSGTWKITKITDKVFSLTIIPTGGASSTQQITVLDHDTVRSDSDGIVSHRTR